MESNVPSNEADPLGGWDLEPVLLHHVLLVLLDLLHSRSAQSEDQVSSFSVRDWKEASYLGTFEIRRYWRQVSELEHEQVADDACTCSQCKSSLCLLEHLFQILF